MKKAITIVLTLFLMLLSGCDFRQRFPINYTYDDYISFSEAMTNITYSEYTSLYGFHCLFFDLDDTDIVNHFAFYGHNYGKERLDSTKSGPVIQDHPNLYQYITFEEAELEFMANVIELTDFDASLITTATTADGFFRLYYQDENFLTVKGIESKIIDFLGEHLEDLVPIELGKNNRPLN